MNSESFHLHKETYGTIEVRGTRDDCISPYCHISESVRALLRNITDMPLTVAECDVLATAIRKAQIDLIRAGESSGSL